MKLRKVLALAAAAVMAVAALASCGVKEDSSNDSKAGGSSEKHYKIGIVQIMEHTSLNTIRDAVIDRLAELGYVDGKRKIEIYLSYPVCHQDTGNIRKCYNRK